MAIFFKFISAKEYDTIPVDGSGAVISVTALKRRIFELKYKSKKKSDSKGLCLGTDFDLVVINAQTNEQYLDDMLIPNNTSVLIRRVPGTRRHKPIDTTTIAITEQQQPLSSSNVAGSSFRSSSKTTDTGSSESGDSGGSVGGVGSFDGSVDMGFGNEVLNSRGEGSFGRTPPEGYVCHRCNVPGHFIQHCPTNGDPNYNLKRVRPLAVMPNPDGVAAFEGEIFGCFPSKRSSPSWHLSDLPPELLCPLCKQVMRNAVLTSKCCFHSFCDKCIRDHLLISKLKCVCGAIDMLTDYLIPNMTLRDTINCILESGSGNSSSGENSKSNSTQVRELANCLQPDISSKNLFAESSVKELKPLSSLANIEDKLNKGKPVDVSESTIGSMKRKVSASEEQVQQKEVSGKIGKKKRKRKSCQDVEAGSFMMPTGYYGYNPYWAGMQVGMEGYRDPCYYSSMSYGLSLSPYGMPFNGQ